MNPEYFTGFFGVLNYACCYPRHGYPWAAKDGPSDVNVLLPASTAEEDKTVDLITERVEVWAASIEDKPGSLANILSGLREAGANLNFILARREPDRPGNRPGKSVVYVTPLAGDAELEAAATLGFNLTARVYSVRVEGQNQPGIAAGLAAKLAAAGLNLRGFSAAVLGTRFILYVGLDSADDAANALTVLQQD